MPAIVSLMRQRRLGVGSGGCSRQGGTLGGCRRSALGLWGIEGVGGEGGYERGVVVVC